MDASTIQVVHNTFFDNDATDSLGGGLFIGFCDSDNQAPGNETANVYNNIVYQNTATDGLDIAAGIFTKCQDFGTLNVFNNDYIDIEIGANVTPNIDAATNFINIDPQWEDPAGDDFHLTATSPVIDKGDLNPPGGLPTPDFDGVTRPQGPLPDMGALEFQAIPTPTPTASPIATPTPTPPATGLLLFGGGCSLGSGVEPAFLFRLLLGIPIVFGLRRIFRRK